MGDSQPTESEVRFCSKLNKYVVLCVVIMPWLVQLSLFLGQIMAKIKRYLKEHLMYTNNIWGKCADYVRIEGGRIPDNVQINALNDAIHKYTRWRCFQFRSHLSHNLPDQPKHFQKMLSLPPVSKLFWKLVCGNYYFWRSFWAYSRLIWTTHAKFLWSTRFGNFFQKKFFTRLNLTCSFTWAIKKIFKKVGFGP